MKSEFKGLLESYFLWIKDKTVLSDVSRNSDWAKITTPHLDRHNDCLEFYIKREDKGFLLSDDGYILEDLEASGCDLSTPKRQELLKITLAGFGIQIDGKKLTTHANQETFPIKKHNFIQAMLAVNDLFYLASPHIASLFYEDVVSWLNLCEIRYTPKIKLTGKSGYDHMFDFVIPKFKTEPERIIQTITHPTKDATQSLMFKWLDTKDTRNTQSRLYAFLNDGESRISKSIISALENYDAVPVPWSKREDYRQELAA